MPRDKNSLCLWLKIFYVLYKIILCTVLNFFIRKVKKNKKDVDSHWSTIWTRLKASIFGAFWIVVLERHEHSFVLRAKNPSKIQVFQVEEFKYNKNFCKQGKSTANTWCICEHFNTVYRNFYIFKSEFG